LVVSLSAPVLLAALVWGLWRYAGLRLWHAVTCVLLGFYLASTSMAPDISKAVRAVAGFLSGLDI
jgi:glucose dehydrogenase